MIEIRQWDKDNETWHMVCRCKTFDELRDDLKPIVAMIDAAEGYLPGVGTIFYKNNEPVYMLEYNDDGNLNKVTLAYVRAWVFGYRRKPC
jgi:hypothetical protein